MISKYFIDILFEYLRYMRYQDMLISHPHAAPMINISPIHSWQDMLISHPSPAPMINISPPKSDLSKRTAAIIFCLLITAVFLAAAGNGMGGRSSQQAACAGTAP